MRALSLLSQCLPVFVHHDRGSNLSTICERDAHLPSPAVEILPSKTALHYKHAGENIDLQGINIYKGRVSVADIIGFTGSETMSLKPDGPLKSWDTSIDLVNVLKHEIRDGQLSCRGKRVLELSCSYGLPGTFACLKSVRGRWTGASLYATHETQCRRITINTNIKKQRNQWPWSDKIDAPFLIHFRNFDT